MHPEIFSGELFLGSASRNILTEPYQDMAGVGGEQPQWITDIIDFDRLYLTELIHVSQGSWQPILYYLL